MNGNSLLIDAAGTRHESIGVGRARIISLVPSITELICDLGLNESLIGRSDACIYPRQQLIEIPKLGSPKDVAIEKIRKLAPSHVIVDLDENETHCVDQLKKFVPHIIVVQPKHPDDNLALFRLLGGIFNAQQTATRIMQRYDNAMNALKDALPPDAPKKIVQVCVWKDPWTCAAQHTYTAAMLGLIGWTVQANALVRFPVFEWDDQLAHQVDLVLLASEPYLFTASDVESLQQQIGKPVQLVDGQLLTWYGSRSIMGLEYLKKLVSAAGNTRLPQHF